MALMRAPELILGGGELSKCLFTGTEPRSQETSAQSPIRVSLVAGVLPYARGNKERLIAVNSGFERRLSI